jgi:hypothetical protein
MSSGNGNGFVTENMVPRHRDGFCPTTRAFSQDVCSEKHKRTTLIKRGIKVGFKEL